MLKPGGHFVFDILNLEQPLVEDWAVETYLGAKVFLESVVKWEKTITGKSTTKTSASQFIGTYFGSIQLFYSEFQKPSISSPPTPPESSPKSQSLSLSALLSPST